MLVGPTILVRKKEVFGIFVGTGPDDPGSLEVRAFKSMRDALARQIDKNVKGGPAITRFVNSGINIVDGDMVVDKKALNNLHRSLRRALGSEVAKQVKGDIQSIVETQWKATQNVVAQSVEQFNRAVSAGITRVDQRVLDVLNNQNNFFISGTYDKTMIDTVNKVVADNVERGLPRRALDIKLRNELSQQLPPRGDMYYKVLANDVVNRARTFSEVNAFVEARIRRYEIFAVMDERTTEICESMDGRIFEVEIARKIVKDITTFGIPGSEAQVDQFKALRPWLALDQDRAEAGKNALYYLDPAGERMYVPDTTFSGTKGDFTSTGAKTQQTSREIQDMAPENANPPVLPPYHANCRTTTVIDEDDVRTQEWTEQLAGSTLGPGQTFFNVGTGILTGVTGTGTTKNGKPVIKTKTKGKTKTEKPVKILKKPLVAPPPPKPPATNKTLDAALEKAQANKTAESTVHPATKVTIRTTPKVRENMTKAEVTKEIKKVRDVLRELPPQFFNNIRSIELHYAKIQGAKSNVLGNWTYREGKMRLRIGSQFEYYSKGKKIVGGFTRRNFREYSKTIVHEVGHAVHPGPPHSVNPRLRRTGLDRQPGMIPNDSWREWLNYDAKMRRKPKKGRGSGKWISDYAKTNEKEHFCEAFSWYFRDPALLAKKEIGAFEFMEEHIKPIVEAWKG